MQTAADVARVEWAENDLTRELGQSLALLALAGISIGGILGMIAIATRALGA